MDDNLSFKFVSRGMGNNWHPCFICGHKPQDKCQADTAFFVEASLVRVSNLIKDGHGRPMAYHPITEWFHKHDILVGKLDYRDYEPNRVQLKLGACGEHKPNLLLLTYLTEATGTITYDRLEMVIPKRKRP